MFYPDWKDWMNGTKMGLNKVPPFIPDEPPYTSAFTPEAIDAAYRQYHNILRDAMAPPQSLDQIRRDWYKTLKTEELWNLHDELLDEIRGRTR